MPTRPVTRHSKPKRPCRAICSGAVRIRFSSIEDVVPQVQLDPNGELGVLAHAEGFADLRALAEWLRALPYGYARSDTPTTVFVDRVGTCEQKHRCFVAAANEAGVGAEWVWGWYQLGADIVAEVAGVLARHAVSYVPMMHCIVSMADGSWLDLTDGNCDGKTRRPDQYDEFHQVSPWADHGEVSALRAEALTRWSRRPEFATVDMDQLLRQASESKTIACRAAGGQIDRFSSA